MDSASTEMSSAHLLARTGSRLAVIGARWYVLVLGTILGAGGGWVWAVNQPRQYEAHATLQLDLDRDYVIDSPGNNEAASAFRVRQERLKTETVLLKSRSIAERVVRKEGLAEGEHGTARRTDHVSAAFEQAVSKVLSSVEVLPIPGTRILTVRARGATPSEAAQIANAVIEAYLEKSMEDRVDASARALKWLQTQQTSLKSDLEDSERAVFKFREEHQALSASRVDRRALIADRHQKYSEALTDLRIKRIHAQARVGILKEAFAPQADPITVQAGPIASDTTLRSLREQYRSLETQFNESSTTVARGSAQTDLKVRLERTRSEIVLQLQAVLGGAEADLKEIERVESGLRQALTELAEQSLLLSREELEAAGLEREYESRRERYTAVLEQAAKAELTRALAATPARTVDRAVPSTSTPSPHAETMARWGALVGLMLSSLGALVKSRGGTT